MSEDLVSSVQSVLTDVTEARQKLVSIAEQMKTVGTISREDSEKLERLYEGLADLFGHADDVLGEYGEALTDLQQRSGHIDEE